MGALRIIVWTVACVGLGLFLGTVDIGGQTAWERARGAWKQQGPRMDKVKEGAEDLVDGTRKKIASVSKDATKEEPKERHSREDKDAIDSLIAKKAKN